MSATRYILWSFLLFSPCLRAGEARAQEENYPPGTFQLTPTVELNLQPVQVSIPQKFSRVPAHVLNLPPGFSASVFAAEGLRTGFKVVALFSRPDGSGARLGDFITGFVTGTERNSVWGMPVGLASDSLGNLYVSSNSGNYLVLKISHSFVSGEWEHNLPDSVALGATLQVEALVRLLRLAEDGPPPTVRVDLSDFGGPKDGSLAATGDSTFLLETTLPVSGATGLRAISVLLAQDPGRAGYWVNLSKTIAVVPASDLEILGDDLSEAWISTAKAGGQTPAFTAGGPVYAGLRAGAFQVRPERSVVNWEVELRTAEPVSPFGFTALRFAFHPGDLQGPLVKSLLVSLEGPSRIVADLLRGSADLRVDLQRQEWQVVEIPLEGLDPEDLLEAIRFSGNLTGTFYIDDLRLVTPPLSALPVTAVLEERTAALPQAFSLEQNYPNPFNSETVIRFAIPARAEVGLVVFNLAGQRVATLAEGRREAGVYALRWDGRDQEGRALASGLYLYRLQAGAQVALRKLVLLR